MGKALSEMTLEELWELFPVFLVEPRAQWAERYRKITSLLKETLLGCPVVRISHIGSTAIQGIWAKDIVDVLIEISVGADLRTAAERIEENGFVCMAVSPDRVSLNRGYTEDGFAKEVYHVHLRYAGDNDELYFRDYLNEHAEVAEEYERIKQKLWRQYEHNRDAYTDAKTEFVRKWTSEARRAYPGRYGVF